MRTPNSAPTRAESEQARSYRRPRVKSSTTVVAAIIFILGGSAFGFALDFNCPAGDVACLISAIDMANGTVEADTINLAAGTYTLSTVDNDTDGPNGLPSISSDITIQGAGATTAIVERDSLASFRIFHVAATGVLTLDSLTVTGGSLDDGNGAGILNAGGALTITDSVITHNDAFQMAVGGGIFNDTGGDLTLSNSTVSLNSSRIGPGGCGGLVNKGVAHILSSTIRQNSGFGIGASSGGIRNTGGTLHVINSTVSKNIANEQNGAGILNEDGGSATISNSTIAENDTPSPFALGGGIFTDDGNVALRNTILVENLGLDPNLFIVVLSNCAGTIASSGNNVIGLSKTEDNCSINPVGSDILDIDAGVLGPFTDSGQAGNGHYPLAPDSPAIDAGNPADPGSGGDACEATDQLGSPRPADGDCDGTAVCDSGSIEFAPPVENVNDELSGTPDPSSFAFDPTPVAEGPAGTFSFTAEFCNVGITSLTCLRSVTTTLTGGNALLNRNSGTPSGVGSELSFPLAQGFADGVLSAGECVDVFYEIGLTAKTSFDFLTDVVGVAP